MFQPADKPYPDDIRPLTSLRFFAALIIAVFHYFLYRRYAEGADVLLIGSPETIFLDIPVVLLGRGYLAVDFFFVLSGFILAHVYGADMRAARTGARDFYVKRLARIYPVHLMTLLIAAGMALHAGGFSFVFARTLFENVLLVHAWGLEQNDTFNRPSWSISAEWFAYLLFPLLLRLPSRIGETAQLLAVSVFFVVLWWAAPHLNGKPFNMWSFDFGNIRILPEFLLGMALYRFGCRYRLVYCGPATLAACLALLFALAHICAPNVLIVPVLGFLILLCAEQSRAGMRGLLDRAFPVWLGQISYSLYMCHYFLVPGHGLDLGFAGFLASCIAAAALSYHLVENPARRAINRRFAQNKDSPGGPQP